MIALRRALLLLPALAACYAYVPPPWAAASPPPRYARRAPARASEPAARLTDEDPPREAAADGAAGPTRFRIVEVALRYLGKRFGGDCSGFVRQVMREADVDLGPLPSASSMSESLHLASRRVRQPAPGDLVFFHDTYDRNRDGKLGDRWTHVALVEAVDGDQVWILHRGGGGIIRLKMNLARPADREENDPVRAKTSHDPPGTRYLTGELFAGFGAVVE